MVSRFADREGHSRVPQTHVELGVPIGSWVAVQRQKRDNLPPERRVKLQKLPGWTWDPHTERWDQTYELLEEYIKEHDTSRVPYDCRFGGVKLGHWVSTQRSSYAKGKLDPARQHKLEKLRGWEWQVT